MGKFRIKDSDSSVHRSIDLFSRPQTNASFNDHDIVVYDPLTTGASNAKFLISSRGAEYMYMRMAKLFVAIRIVADEDGADLPDDEIVVPANGIFSLFSQVDVEFNSKLMVDQTKNHPYANIFDVLFDYDPDGQSGTLEAMGYYKDTAYQHSKLGGFGDLEIPSNQGNKTRWQHVKGSRRYEMEGPIGADVLTCERMFLNSVDILLTFHFSSPEFFLMAEKTDKRYKIVVEDMYIKVPHVSLNSAVLLGHDATLKSFPSVYMYMKKEFSAHVIDKKTLKSTAQNVFQGKLPNKLVIALVDDRAYAGDYERNPFEFGHFGLKSVDARVNSKLVNSKRIKLETSDPDNLQYVEAYSDFLNGVGRWDKNRGCIVQRGDFCGGYTLFVYDFENGFADEANYPVFEKGAMHVDFTFNASRDHAIQAIFCGYFRTAFGIDNSRRIVSPPKTRGSAAAAGG